MSTAKKNNMREASLLKTPRLISIPGSISHEEKTDTGLHFRKVIENADGVPFHLIFGSRLGEGYYMSIGEGIEQLTGIPADKFTEKNFYNIVEKTIPLTDDIPADPVISREKFINGEIRKYKAEILIRLETGERKWIRDSSLPLIDDETGKVIGSYGILFEITSGRQSDTSFASMNEQPDTMDLLKTTFLQNISHEIRTPLNAIVGFSTLLCEPDGMDHRTEYLNIINNNTDQLLEVLDQIVEISKIEANAIKVNRKEVSIRSLLERVLTQFKPKASEKNIILRLNSSEPETDISIITDSYKLNQVLINLVGNSIKFTNTGTVEFGYILRNSDIEFYIADTGISIPIEHQSKIFSRFFQVENISTRRYQGTGLGLAITKAYVELLGGTIWFTSEQGKGTTFNFTLPLKN